MTYIINPMWFYWLSVADKVCQAAYTLAIPLFAFSIASYVVAAVLKFVAIDDYDGINRESPGHIIGTKLQRAATALAVIAAILYAIYTFVPSRETLIEMQIARFTTVENAEWALDAIKSATDYIVSAIKELP